MTTHIAESDRPLAEQRVYRSIYIDGHTGCWLWKFRIDRNGYGRTKHRGQSFYAHRFAWEALVGPVPDGKVCDHLCRTTRCINPNHIEVVTIRQNMLRGHSLAAIAVRNNVCKNGHALVGENVRFRANGTYRHCKTCGNAAVARYAAKKARGQ